jgi:hypothetical protein
MKTEEEMQQMSQKIKDDMKIVLDKLFEDINRMSPEEKEKNKRALYKGTNGYVGLYEDHFGD